MNIYELAFLLHKTVGEVVGMTYAEYLGWQAYFAARPVGWREDQRVMPLLQIKGVKAKPHEIFPSLIPIYNPEEPGTVEDGMVKASSLKKSALFSKLIGATGGDNVDIFGTKGAENAS
jgi:hypothetical protein